LFEFLLFISDNLGMETTIQQAVNNDVETIGRISGVQNILKVLRQITGMRITLVARVTDSSWTACAVSDEADFGLKSGDQLEVTTTY
jgi:hypothetical protein